MIGMFALGMDAYVIAGIMPEISVAFAVGTEKSAQMVTVFTLCYAISAPVFATLLSSMPTKKVLIYALVVFTGANLLSVFSPNIDILLVSRAIAGLGAGLFSPLAAATAATLVPPEKKGRALGMILGGMSAGTVVGVPLGLIFSSYWGWESVFWLVILIGLIGLAGIIFGLKAVDVSVVAAPASFKERVTLLTNGKVASVVGVTFLSALASLGLYTYTAPILSDLTTNANITPYLWVWGSVEL